MRSKERWIWLWITTGLCLFALGITLVASVALYSLNQSQDRQDASIAIVCLRQDNVVRVLSNLTADEAILTAQIANRVKINNDPTVAKAISDFKAQNALIMSIATENCAGKN